MHAIQCAAVRRGAQPAAVPSRRGIPAPNRKCMSAGNQAMLRALRAGTIQAKLTVNTAGDCFEQEAERVADEVMAQRGPGRLIPVGAGSLQRMCAECEEEVHRKSGAANRGRGEVSAALEEQIGNLRGRGQPLPRPVRSLLEPRFRCDFGDVRVHTDAPAAETTRSVNALAYTVGRDIVFAPAQYAPESHDGQRLLAHELAHVVQQQGIKPPPMSNAPSEQGYDSRIVQPTGMLLARAWNPCGEKKDCPPRRPGERDRAAAVSLQVGTIESPERGEIITHFDVGSSSTRGLSGDPTWEAFVAQITAEDSRWEILGFSDCEGPEALNTDLRQQRAEAVLRALPAAARAKIDRALAAPLSDCVALNYMERDRSLNRSVAFRRTAENLVFPAETVTVTPPRFVCGPDVTAKVQSAVAGIGTTFAGWSSSQKEDACDALDSYRTGGYAWDIVELHNNAWILSFRPTCATEHATPHCGSSVQVGPECYYAGSANYVIFGKMCRLCAAYYLSIPLISTGYARFTRNAMRDLINLYKSGATNVAPSIAWAEAGHDGWPSGGSPPTGDRSNCAPLCPSPYTGPDFHVNWYPNQFYTGGVSQ